MKIINIQTTINYKLINNENYPFNLNVDSTG
jgi:hypothetical protein